MVRENAAPENYVSEILLGILIYHNTTISNNPPASKGDLISITPTEGPLIDRGCGVTGAGKSPIKNPGKNWALTPVFGDVGEPSIIGSDPKLIKK